MKYIINIYKHSEYYSMEVYAPYYKRVVRGSDNLDRLEVLEQTIDFIRQHSGDTFEIIDCDHLKRESEKYNMSHHK